MQYITFDESKPLDLILLGRIAIDFNPLDYYKTLAESETFKKYVGGSRRTLRWDCPGLAKNAVFLPGCQMTGLENL